MNAPDNEVSQTLSRVHERDPQAAAQLMGLVYEPLRKLAHDYFHGQGRKVGRSERV